MIAVCGMCYAGCHNSCEGGNCYCASHDRQINLFDGTLSEKPLVTRANSIYIGCELIREPLHWTAVLNTEIRYLSGELTEGAIIHKANEAGIKLTRYMPAVIEEPFHTMFAHVRHLVVILHEQGAANPRYYGVIKKTIPHNPVDSERNTA